MKSSSRAWLPRLLVAGLALACIPVVRQYPHVFFEYQLDYGEGFIQRTALMIAHGQPIYRPWHYPVGGLDAFYPPVYFVVYALLIVLFSPSLALGRLISLAASLGLATLIWRIVKRETNSTLCACAASVCFVAFRNDFTMLARVDALASFLACAGLFVVYRQVEDAREVDATAITRATLLLVLSALTKQNAVAGFLALIAFLVVGRQYRVAIRACSLYFGLLALATGVLAWSTQGRYLFLVFGLPTFASFSWSELLLRAFYYFLPASLLLLVSALVLGRARPKGGRITLLACYALAACVIALAAGKDGASYNYFIELSVVASVAFGISLQYLDTVFDRPLPRAGLWAGLIAGVLLFTQSNWNYVRDSLDGQRTINQGLERLLGRIDGPVLCEDASILVRRGQADNSVEWFVYTNLWTAGKLDQGKFLEDLRNGTYRALIFVRIGRPFGPVEFYSRDRVTPEQAELIRRGFRSIQPAELPVPERFALAKFLVLVPCSGDCRGPAVVPGATGRDIRDMLARRDWERIRSSVLGR